MTSDALLVIDFAHPASTEVALSGGKGANLARLTHAGFAVPPAWIISSHAYERWLLRARPIIAKAQPFATDDPAALEAQCAPMLAALAEIPLPESVQAAIAAAVAGQSGAFSVRSSATLEDSAAHAFAGQHETYLNCSGTAEILRRVHDCWLSMWAPRALAYRVQAGYDPFAAKMAVVVQRMVFCDVAGVGFSINPVAGRLDQQVIDANYGLGESVVGGETVVDHFVVEKSSGAVSESHVAEKEHKIVRDPSGAQGTVLLPLSAGERFEPCLSPSQIAELSALLTRVEKAFSYPQDIEWGFENGRLWLLQSRPVTRIPARYTRDESAERFPNVVTPLAWDLVEDGFHRSLNYSFRLMGIPPYRDKWFAMFDHYIYGNQNAVEIYAGALFGEIKTPEQLMAVIPTLASRFGWVLELPMEWSRDLDTYLLRIGELNAERLEGKSLLELWAHVLKVRDIGAEYFLPNIAISLTQRTLYRILLGLLTATVGAERAASLFDALLAFCETKTGAINREMFVLATRIRDIPELAKRLAERPSREFLEQGGFAGWPEIAETFRRFVRNHGHREMDFDPYHASWAEAPWLVVENLKGMLRSAAAHPGEKEMDQRIRMAEAEAALMAQVPEALRFFMHELIRLARTYTTLDDVEHYQTTRLTLPFRRGLRALGQVLQARGIVDDPMDVFFVRVKELDAAIHADDPRRWLQLRARLYFEKQSYLVHREISPLWQIGGADETPPKAGSLKGLPGSAGVREGVVHRVRSVDDFATFPEGAVLVARTTNPAWTPLFYRASAVVTEAGGPLSHGAVTAREMDLPAVMAVRDALERLPDGTRVGVDGSRGLVTILS